MHLIEQKPGNLLPQLQKNTQDVNKVGDGTYKKGPLPLYTETFLSFGKEQDQFFQKKLKVARIKCHNNSVNKLSREESHKSGEISLPTIISRHFFLRLKYYKKVRLNKIGLKFSRGKIQSLVKNLVTFLRFYFSYQSLFLRFIFLLITFPSLNFKLNSVAKTENLYKTFYLCYILLIKR